LPFFIQVGLKSATQKFNTRKTNFYYCVLEEKNQLVTKAKPNKGRSRGCGSFDKQDARQAFEIMFKIFKL